MRIYVSLKLFEVAARTLICPCSKLRRQHCGKVYPSRNCRVLPIRASLRGKAPLILGVLTAGAVFWFVCIFAPFYRPLAARKPLRNS